jgi:hypothetical protein
MPPRVAGGWAIVNQNHPAATAAAAACLVTARRTHIVYLNPDYEIFIHRNKINTLI